MSQALLDRIQSPNRNYSPKSNPATLKGFIDGGIHTDFLQELAIRIEDLRDFNEECNSKEYLETRGAIKFARMLTGIFTDLYANSISDTEEEK